MKRHSIIIDPEFRALIPPMSADERAQLKENIRAHGLLDSIIVWSTSGGFVIVDGHHRYEILKEFAKDPQSTTFPAEFPQSPKEMEQIEVSQNGIDVHPEEFWFRSLEFENREAVKLWILQNQIGRRNLTKEQRVAMVAQIVVMREALHKSCKPDRHVNNVREAAKEFNAPVNALQKAVTAIKDNQPKPTTCDICHAPFESKGVMKAHRHKDHALHNFKPDLFSLGKPCLCPECGEQLPSLSAGRKHGAERHGYTTAADWEIFRTKLNQPYIEAERERREKIEAEQVSEEVKWAKLNWEKFEEPLIKLCKSYSDGDEHVVIRWLDTVATHRKDFGDLRGLVINLREVAKNCTEFANRIEAAPPVTPADAVPAKNGETSPVEAVQKTMKTVDDLTARMSADDKWEVYELLQSQVKNKLKALTAAVRKEMKKASIADGLTEEEVSFFKDFRMPKRDPKQQEAQEATQAAKKKVQQFVRDIIKEGRRALAAKHHPDKGGSTEDMIAVNAAEQLLQESAAH